jgi:hypothetical protein
VVVSLSAETSSKRKAEANFTIIHFAQNHITFLRLRHLLLLLLRRLIRRLYTRQIQHLRSRLHRHRIQRPNPTPAPTPVPTPGPQPNPTAPVQLTSTTSPPFQINYGCPVTQRVHLLAKIGETSYPVNVIQCDSY